MRMRMIAGLSAVLLAGSALIPATGWAQSGTVSVYTAHAPEIYNEIVPKFEAATGITVSLVQAGSGDIVQRARAEAARPLADVIWSVGGEALEANSDLLEPYTSAHDDMIDPLYKVGTNWLPYTGIPMVMVVNTDMVSADEMPTSWADLADEKWDQKIAFAGADSSGSAFMQLATVLDVYGEEEGWELFEAMMGNFIITNSSGRVPRGTADGEFAIGLTLEEAAQRYVAGGAPVTIVYPEPATSALPDAVALVKDGPNPEAGKAFVDFVLSQEIQEFLVETMQRRSIRTDVAQPDGLPGLDEVSIQNYDMAWAGAERDNIIRRYLSILRQ
jgi:iron(III) transport system substrate-binding protein